MRTFFVILLVLAVSVSLTAQPLFYSADNSYLQQFRGMSDGSRVGKIWLDVCELNRDRYPDSNRVSPGDVIRVPTGKYYVAGAAGLSTDAGEANHMWEAAEIFHTMVVTPYLIGGKMAQGDTLRADKNTVALPKIVEVPESSSFPWGAVVVSLLIISLLVLIFRYNERKKELVSSGVPPDFTSAPPDFERAGDEQVRFSANSSLQRAFGRGFTIVGPIERGHITGKQTVFFRDGSHRTETFKREPGFRARLRFQNGVERLVVCRWSCFNPCWSAESAEFQGIFVPESTNEVSSPIPTITTAQAKALGDAIRDQEAVPMPAIPSSASDDEVTKEITEEPTGTNTGQNGRLHLTKVQVSRDKGVNLEGDFALEIKDLRSIIEEVMSVELPGPTGPEKK